ncbi:MAG: T9SS type A sorting domain-containing protein [Crocinitomicaceae bacterium]|nr:S8 family peptidase [Flavobacteriales bacterium]NQZ36541.1 T9SS type A sorting domain-containing protein [Crocinitomicaceae bacterium]
MKHLLPMLVAIFASISFYGASQKTHFDNKPYVEGEMLVQIIDNVSLKAILHRAPAEYKLDYVKELSSIMRVSLLSFNTSAISHEGIQFWLYSQPEVSIVDYNYYVQMRSTLPGDPSITQQWHHNNTGAGGGTVDADIDSDLAWDITTGGTTATGDDIVVCLIEGGGGNLDHADLSPNRWVNTGEIDGNGIDDDGNGYVDDYNGWNTGSNNDDYGNSGHGTNCLGMIGAKGNNGIAVAGANWDVKLMVMNMGGGLTQANVIAAYTYPLVMRQMWNNSGGTEGAFVVATSASWGIDGANPNSYPLWCQFYDTMGVYGILNVGATTNQNLDVDVQGDMPTACNSDYMIGVGRTDNNDNTAGGYGDQTIEFGAPGIDVVTTSGTSNGSTGTTTTTGTSFSCPLTAGVIGLAYSIPCADFMAIVVSNPQAAADLVLQAMLDGTDPKAQLTSKFVTGGRLNSRNTLDELMAVACSGTICLGPSGVSTGSITDNSASIAFTPNGSATATNFYWREVGAAAWIAINSATSPISLTSLTNCTDYEYYFQSICGADMSSPTSTQSFGTTGCGTCVDLPYCTSAATDGADEWIGTFEIGTYTNASGNDGGYGNYVTSGSIPVQTNTTYNVTITPEWGGTDYDEYTRVWVDVNQNGTFEAEELLFDQTTASQTAATGTITIPSGATLGNTRLRVQMAYQGAGQTALPPVCGDFTWGEVEDYCLDITTGTGGGGGAGIDALTDGTVSVYPNPTNGEVNFVITSPSVVSITIIDLVGKVIETKSVKSELTQFNLNAYSNGTYFYRLIDANGSTLVTEKLIRVN